MSSRTQRLLEEAKVSAEHTRTIQAAFDKASAAGEDLDDASWFDIISSSLRYHREERAKWRQMVQDLPAHLKEQALCEDLGGMMDASPSGIVDKQPASPQRAVRLPPPPMNAFKMLTPTISSAAVELRQSRADAGSDDQLPSGEVTPEATVPIRPRIGGHLNEGLILPTKDPLRSVRASPAQLPQGGLSELQKVLAKRRASRSSADS